MAVDWSPLQHELARWRAEGHALPLWWRDDDAKAATAPLERLVLLSEKLGLPVHLAVIPKAAEDTLKEVCALPHVSALVHGWAHQNHAPEGQKKAEFGHPRAGLADEAARSLSRLQGLFGADLLSVFVPPWNRIAADFVSELQRLGYIGLSTFTPRTAPLAVPGLAQINTHIDPVDWRSGGGLLAEEMIVSQLVSLLQDRRSGRADAAEPLGLLTHHLVHDAAIWGFTEQLIGRLLEGGAVPVNLLEMRGNLP